MQLGHQFDYLPDPIHGSLLERATRPLNGMTQQTQQRTLAGQSPQTGQSDADVERKTFGYYNIDNNEFPKVRGNNED